MFPHLVDPAPPSVGEAEREAVKAEGRQRLHRRRRRRIAVGCAAAVVGLLGVGGLVVQNDLIGDPVSVTARLGDGRGLTGIEWRLQALSVSGVDQVLPTGSEAILRFDGAGRFTGTACNHFGGEVKLGDDRLHFSHEGSTLMECWGAVAAVEGQMGRLLSDKVAWSLNDGVLRLEADGIVARFAERDTPFPTRDLHVLASGNGPKGQFQFGYHTGEGFPPSLLWEGRAAPGHPWGRGGFAVVPGSTDVMSARLGTRVFVYGYMPPGTVRAEYRSQGRSPTPLEVAPLPGGAMAFWGFVPATGGQAVAFDRADREVGRSRSVPDL